MSPTHRQRTLCVAPTMLVLHTTTTMLLLACTASIIISTPAAAASTPPPPPVGRVGIRNAAYGTYLQGHGGGRPSPTMGGTMSAWEVEAFEGGKYTIYSTEGGFLRSDPNLSVNTVPKCEFWENWFIEDHPYVAGKYLIRSSIGTYLRTQDGSTSAQLGKVIGLGDAWELVLISSPTTVAPGPEIPIGDVVIRNAHGGAFLYADSLFIRLTSDKGLLQTWRVTKLPGSEGVYAFRSYYGQYLRVTDRTVTTSYNSLVNEKWSVEAHPSFPGKVAIRWTQGGTYLCMVDSTYSTTDTKLSSSMVDAQCAWDIIPRPTVALRPQVPTGDVWIQSSLGGFLRGSSSVTYSATKGTSEKWRALLSSEGVNVFRSHGGSYLTGNSNNGVGYSAFNLIDEKWSMDAHPTVPDHVAIRSTYGAFLCVDDGSYPAMTLLTSITARCAWSIKDANMNE